MLSGANSVVFLLSTLTNTTAVVTLNTSYTTSSKTRPMGSCTEIGTRMLTSMTMASAGEQNNSNSRNLLMTSFWKAVRSQQ